MRRIESLCLLLLGCAHAEPTPRPAALTEVETRMRRYTEAQGDLLLACEPKDAQVVLDGVPQGDCSDFGPGRGLTLGSGVHQVVIEKPGYLSERRVLSLGGLRGSLEVSLRPAGGG